MSRDLDDVLGSTRPKPKRGAGRKRQELGKLYDMLKKAFPDCVGGDGLIDVGRLAKTHIGISKQAVYKWMQNDRIPANQAFRVVEMCENRVSHEDFKPFIV